MVNIPSVTVGDQALSSQAALGAAGIVVDLIDGGSSWLSWAIANPNVRYNYADAGSLVTAIQSGLHGTELLLLRELDLLVHPLKLMELEPDELLLLAALKRKSDGATLLQARQILNKHKLHTQANLQVCIDFLVQTGVRDHTIFSNLALANLLALFALIDEASTESAFNPMLQKEAASFAASHAQSVFEFLDYHKFYLAILHGSAPDANDASARASRAETLRAMIEPLLYGLLACPTFSGVLTVEEVIADVQKWLAMGDVLGFPRLSKALTQIVQIVDLHHATAQVASALIQEYAAQSALIFNEQLTGSTKLTQDGRERFYTYQGKSGSIQLCHSSDGGLTLTSFSPSAQVSHL